MRRTRKARRFSRNSRNSRVNTQLLPPSLNGLALKMNSLTRQIARLSVHAPRSVVCALPVAARPASRPFASTSSLPSAASTRTYATEAAHLGNLSPSPGSSHKVTRHRLIANTIGTFADLLKLSAIRAFDHSGNVSVAELDLVEAGLQDAVTRGKELALAMANQLCISLVVRLLSLEPTRSVDSKIRKYRVKPQHGRCGLLTCQHLEQIEPTNDSAEPRSLATLDRPRAH